VSLLQDARRRLLKLLPIMNVVRTEIVRYQMIRRRRIATTALLKRKRGRQNNLKAASLYFFLTVQEL
jgi:hypothetical protein